MADRSSSLPHGWRRKSFSELADVSFSGVDKKTTPGEIPVRLCNYVDVFHNHRIHRGIDFMTATASEREVANFKLLQGDVVFTKDSETPEEIAEPAYVAEDLSGVVCGYHLAIARPKKDVDGRFLYYAMKETGIRRQFTRSANGVTRFGLTLDAFDKIFIPTPVLEEQTRIAEILSTWDETLARLSLQIERKEKLLESIRERLTHGAHRLCGRSSPWPMVALSEVTRQLTERNGDRYGRDLVMGVTKAEGIVPMREHVVAENISRYLVLPPNGFAYNPMRINIGSIAMSEHEGDVIVSPDYVVFACKEDRLHPRFLNHLRRTKAWADFMTIAGNGSVRVRIYYASLAEFEFHLPPLDEQRAIVEVLDDAEREIAALEAERAALTRQQDALATELLTGRLRAPQAEATS
jgi:type I restriction enzyme S subunit